MRISRSLALGLGLFLAACGSDNGGTPGDGGGGGGDGGGGGGDGGGPVVDAGMPPLLNDAGQALCQDSTGAFVVCQCADGMDNDGDGVSDGADPECAGPFDNDESSFATGIPGDNSDPYAQDCFFDGDSGGGNDGCRWDIRCMDTTPPYEGTHCNNNTTAGCANCQVLTPNGCDCFGCCDVYVDGVPHRVRIVDTCTTTVIDDPALCPPCEFVTDCYNPCDPCEYCIGHDPDPGCTSGPCPDGVTQCDPDGACPSGYGCVSGCCQPIIG